MNNLKKVALIYEIPAVSWRSDALWPPSADWTELKTGFLISNLQDLVQAWRVKIPSGAPEAAGESKTAGGEALVFRYFSDERTELTTTWAVFMPDDLSSDMAAEDLYSIERKDKWKAAARQRLGRALGPVVGPGPEGSNPFQPLGRAALIGAGPPRDQEVVAEASRILRGSITLGGEDAHWYHPDSQNTAVLVAFSGFLVFSNDGHFLKGDGDRSLPNQFERFLLLYGLAHAYRRALVESSRALAEDIPKENNDSEKSEACYRRLRELYDRLVRFEARCYLFSNPVDEANAECSGMARFVMQRLNLEQLRSDLNAQLDRLQELANRYLAEREARRRQEEAKATARRQRWLNGIVTVLGLALAVGQTWFGWLSVNS